jgi:uncharacterized membrane protein
MAASIYSAARWSPWALAPAALALAAVCVPYLLTRHSAYVGFSVQHAFSLVCHQRPDRCFWIFGAPVAVCTRCLGIYIGAAIGLLLRTSRVVAMRLFIAAAGLNALDVVTEMARLHGNWMGARFVLGLALGTAAALLIASSSVPEVQVAQ